MVTTFGSVSVCIDCRWSADKNLVAMRCHCVVNATTVPFCFDIFDLLGVYLVLVNCGNGAACSCRECPLGMIVVVYADNKEGRC